ncbi:MAG: hypothetical protein ACLQVF_17630 [Isosphaeraceae bacterium]
MRNKERTEVSRHSMMFGRFRFSHQMMNVKIPVAAAPPIDAKILDQSNVPSASKKLATAIS